MENSNGKNVCEAAAAETGAAKNEYLLISNTSEESLSFEPSQSYAVAFSINCQTSPLFQRKALGDTVVNDARKVLSALQESGAVPRENAKLIQAKRDLETCTFTGMKNGFQKQAKKVRKGGIFFFHFSGHGIKTKNNQFGLAPVDFDYKENTYITASVLSQWLREASCEAKYVHQWCSSLTVAMLVALRSFLLVTPTSSPHSLSM